MEEEKQKEKRKSAVQQPVQSMKKKSMQTTCTRGQHTRGRGTAAVLMRKQTDVSHWGKKKEKKKVKLQWKMVGGKKGWTGSEKLDGTEVNHAPCVNSLPKPLVLLLAGADLRSAPEIPV